MILLELMYSILASRAHEGIAVLAVEAVEVTISFATTTDSHIIEVLLRNDLMLPGNLASLLNVTRLAVGLVFSDADVCQLLPLDLALCNILWVLVSDVLSLFKNLQDFVGDSNEGFVFGVLEVILVILKLVHEHSN